LHFSPPNQRRLESLTAIADSGGCGGFNHAESCGAGGAGYYILWETKRELAGISDSSLIRSVFDPMVTAPKFLRLFLTEFLIFTER